MFFLYHLNNLWIGSLCLNWESEKLKQSQDILTSADEPRKMYSMNTLSKLKLSRLCTVLKLSSRLKSRLCTVLKCAVCSVLILGFIVTILSLIDHITDEAYHLINHQIYSPKSLYWDRELLVEKLVQIVGLPIPCSLIFIIFEFLMEIYDIVYNIGKPDEQVKANDDRGKDKIKELQRELMRVYDMHESVGKTHDYIKEMREQQLHNILESLTNDETRAEYLQNLLSYNRYVLELNRDCDVFDAASLWIV